MTKPVERYQMHIERYVVDGEDAYMVESKEGDYVEYNKYESLRQQLEAAQKALSDSQAEVAAVFNAAKGSQDLAQKLEEAQAMLQSANEGAEFRIKEITALKQQLAQSEADARRYRRAVYDDLLVLPDCPVYDKAIADREIDLIIARLEEGAAIAAEGAGVEV